MKGWKSLFQDHILERGKAYFYDGAVIEFNETEDGYQAVVTGTKEYEVDIEVKNGIIGNMYCSCPYALDDHNCKHMAAALYYMEYFNKTADFADFFEEAQMEASQQTQKELENIIDGIPEEALRAFVKELANSNSQIQNKILTNYAAKIDAPQIDRLKLQVEAIVSQYEDDSGFIDYYNALDFASELYDFLYQNVTILLKRDCALQAFEMTNYIFETICDVDMDDSSGSTTMLADGCYENWKKILKYCNKEEQKKMFSWFVQHQVSNNIVDYMEEYVQTFLMEEFEDPELLEQTLALLDDLIEKQTAVMQNDTSSWNAQYRYNNAITNRLEIMQKLKYPHQEIKTYRKKHWDIAAVRQQDIQENITQGNIQQAIQVLLESKRLDNTSPGLIDQYSEQLIALYEKQEDADAYKKELLFYVFQCLPEDLTYILKLKAACTETEWAQYRQQLLNSDKQYRIHYPLMAAEGLYKQMLECLKNESSIHQLDHWEKVLKKQFPEQVRDLYLSYLQKVAKNASDRNQYRQWMYYLKKINNYPGGKEKAKELAEEWRTKYGRRSAMMDELRQAGF